MRSTVSGAVALERASLKRITLGPKEGLALINGTQPSTAVLALALASAEQLARAAIREYHPRSCRSRWEGAMLRSRLTTIILIGMVLVLS